MHKDRRSSRENSAFRKQYTFKTKPIPRKKLKESLIFKLTSNLFG